MSERLTDEDFDRVRLMASGDPTWDLSGNDLKALSAVVIEVDALRAELTTAKQTAEDRRQAIMDLHDDRDRGWGAGRR